ncbi:MAG TPA: hypothetical protein VD866_23485 [Urbifossiella sp.]|nr:hypothetical protein [Urbifossiella sp.]
MSSTLSFTFDPRYGLSLVSGEAVVLDLTGVHIDQNKDGTYSCAVTRGEERPVRLVATATPEGRLALERANGRECQAVPGFVEVTGPNTTAVSTLAEDIARHLGWERPAD